MFTLLGGLLIVFGLMADKSVFQHSLGINVNFWWGILMLVFGIAMFFWADAVQPQRDLPKKVLKA
jgi:hypothetical protein